MNIFKKYSNQLKLIEENYNKKEITRSYFGALLAVLIIAVPLILFLVQLFSIFLMRPYLMEIIAVIIFEILFLCLFIFKNSILKKYRIVEEISYKLVLLFEFISVSIFIIIIAVLIALFIIPLVVL